MDIKNYLDSGILEMYCMGLLTDEERSSVEYTCSQHPEIKEELNRIELVLEQYCLENALAPPVELKKQILQAMNSSRPETQYPLIHASSDHRLWLDLVKDVIPESFGGKRFVKTLAHSAAGTQVLLISSSDFEEETHDDLRESFLILDGICECTVGDRVFSLGPGGFTEIPLHQPHSVKVLSPTVTAVLQRLPLNSKTV